MAKRQRYDLFVSFADADEAWVRGKLLPNLDAPDYSIHTESPSDLIGVPIVDLHERIVTQSGRILLVLSPDYFADPWENYLSHLAQTRDVAARTQKVIPIVYRDVTLPLGLAARPRHDFTGAIPFTEAIGNLLAELKRPPPKPEPLPRCPYPGMRAYDESWRDRFFGRRAEIIELKRRVKHRPFLAVIGPSGCGKSSLVFAGLVPALRQSARSEQEQWRFYTLRPGADPLNAQSTQLLGRSRKPGPPLADLIASPRAGRTLIVIDQYEELFTIANRDKTRAEEVHRFQDLIGRGAEHERCHVVITARSDFYGELMAGPLWARIKADRMELPPLGADQLREAITMPAASVRVYIEPLLVAQILHEARNEPGVLPLVQETLVRLWGHLDQRFLPFLAYQEMVNADRADRGAGDETRTGLQVAVARHADDIFGRLTTEKQAIARRIFLRLIAFGDGRAHTRRQQPESELRAGSDPQLFDDVIAVLVQERLLTVSSTDGNGDG